MKFESDEKIKKSHLIPGDDVSKSFFKQLSVFFRFQFVMLKLT